MESNAQKGFTLIELVVVIIILGILTIAAVPKFLDLNNDAEKASVRSTGGSFLSGIKLARSVWIAKGAAGPMDDVFVYSNNLSGSVDFNSNGWPAQHYTSTAESSPELGNVQDCISVWQIIFANNEPSISQNSNTKYKAVYVTNNKCRFEFNDNTTYKIEYDSNTGAVVTTTP